MRITDIHICAPNPEKSLMFQEGIPRKISQDEVPLVQQLLGKSKEVQRPDFLIDSEGTFYRGRINNAVDGTWYKLRILAKKASNLDETPSPIPLPVKSALLTDAFTSGWIHICGAAGSGKTTTGSATLVSRLQKRGGSAQTVEDPPELPLNGWHGEGWCSQTWVAGEKEADWAETIRGVLRSQPSGAKLMLYIGEIRDKECAREALRAASNGFLVISTGFASDLVSGVDTLYQMLGDSYKGSLADVLRVVVYQSLVSSFKVGLLVSEGANSRVAAIIRAGRVAQLQDEVSLQGNMYMRGQLPFEGK